MREHDDLTFGKYKREVKKWLMADDYHYSAEQAEERISQSAELVKASYDCGESARDCAIDIGYSCG